ncbi:MAG: transporter [Candidatus Omnitrophica bacterium]|nr:transporter [Candidatus Omnitrophota bacterium]
MSKKALIFLFIFSITALFAFSSNQQEEKNKPETYSTTITWHTDKPCTSQAEFGTDTDYQNKTQESKELTIEHEIVLDNLQPATLYHYRVISRDSQGNEIISPDYVFVTPHESKSQDLPKISQVSVARMVASMPVIKDSRQANASSKHKLISMVSQLSDKEADAIVAAGASLPAGEKQRIESGASGSAGTKETAGDLDTEAGQLVKQEASIEEALVSKGGLLLPKGKFQYEPSVTYAHVSANNISFQGLTTIGNLVLLGLIDSQKIKRDITIISETFRYGLLDNWQIDAKVPYKFQYERVSTGNTSEISRDHSGIGDVEAGVYHHLIHENGAIPDIVLGVTQKFDTGKSPYNTDIGLGTGHKATNFSLVWVKSADPAILFGSLGYTMNYEDDIENFGKVDPGNTYQYTLGTAFALNYNLSLSLAIEHLFAEKMTVNGIDVMGSLSNAASFKTGVSWAINDNLSMQFDSAYGLTEDAADFVLEIRFPITF